MNSNYVAPNAASNAEAISFLTNVLNLGTYALNGDGLYYQSSSGGYFGLHIYIDDALISITTIPIASINATNARIDGEGAVNAIVGLIGGVAEMAVGGAAEYFSAGTSSTASVSLMVDGFARTVANAQRLFMYCNGNAQTANAYPTSIGAIAGKSIDMAFGVSFCNVGFGQAIGGWGNDLTSFVVMGGNGGALLMLQKSPSLETGLNYGYSLFSYPYSMYYNKPSK